MSLLNCVDHFIAFHLNHTRPRQTTLCWYVYSYFPGRMFLSNFRNHSTSISDEKRDGMVKVCSIRCRCIVLPSFPSVFSSISPKTHVLLVLLYSIVWFARTSWPIALSWPTPTSLWCQHCKMSSYTSFSYSKLTVSSSTIGPCDDVQVTVDVTNTGTVDGEEVVQAYVTTPKASVPAPRYIRRWPLARPHHIIFSDFL